MQKKLIALAVAGLASTAAFAQTNVTIYGVADAAFVNASGDNGTNNSFNGINSGVLAGSRLGFRGEEALGNGLKAVFTLEYALDLDQNTGIGSTTASSGLQSRQSFVGLSHAKLGTLTLGRQYAPGFFAAARNDILAASSVLAPLNLMSGAYGATINAGSNARWNNAIAYQSPTIAGFSARAVYGYGEAQSNANTPVAGNSTGNDGRWGVGLNYANGPINADFAYHSRRDITANAAGFGTAAALVPAAAAATGDKNINEWFVGGSYDFKVAKVKATYQRQDDKNGTSAQQVDARVWSVGVEVPVFGNGTVHAGYSDLGWRSTGTNLDSDGWSVGYTHALSKRTTLYTAYTSVDNDSASRAVAGNTTVRARDERHGIFAAGISHSF